MFAVETSSYITRKFVRTAFLGLLGEYVDARHTSQIYWEQFLTQDINYNRKISASSTLLQMYM